jgi:hypothetical protein
MGQDAITEPIFHGKEEGPPIRTMGMSRSTSSVAHETRPVPPNAPRDTALAALAALLLVSPGLPGCSPSEAAGKPGYRATLVEKVPHVRQLPDFCGEACASMALRRLGFDYSQEQVFAATGVSPLLGRGAVTKELAAGLRKIGFDVGAIWYHVRVASLEKDLEQQFRSLHADLLRGVPSILCTRFDESPDTTEHFRLVLGYDAVKDDVIYNDPALDNGGYLRMKRARLLSLWPLKYRRDRWLVIRMPLDPKKIAKPAPAGSGAASPAALAQHVRELRARIARRHLKGSFTVVLEPPFVVVGDEWRGDVERRARETVRWAVDLLKQDFFAKDPAQILDVYLFKDRDSYVTNTRLLTGSVPDTPFGFYSEAHRALIMNISTGGGTLVHEIVHPFVEANFPNCPSWFNEGLGSLYEASSYKAGHIVGLTNWRLPSLKDAIRRGTVPSFKALLSSGTNDFYEKDPGTNYAQARYLVYYLQDRGLLTTYYHAFVAGRQKDPTGIETLKRVIGRSDLAAFKKDWEAYVLGLKWVRY